MGVAGLIISLMIVICFIMAFIAYTIYAIHQEKKGYNNGICPICGEKLEQFDIDSQGGRGYKCPSYKHSYYTWVSYHCVDGK